MVADAASGSSHAGTATDSGTAAADDQAGVTRRYDRLAAWYDRLNGRMERGAMGARRNRLLGRATGRTLEVGVGTGRNLALYPPGVSVLGTDVSARMLDLARVRAADALVPVHLEVADVQHLPYAPASFDTAVATCVFCSVPDPVAGLRELRRVVRPGGRILLLEHVRPRGFLPGLLADVVSIATARLLGPRFNRRTEENVREAGLRILGVHAEGIWREIVAEP